MRKPPIKIPQGYDHIHWTVINGKKGWEKGVGTLADVNSECPEEHGKAVLLGRGSDGWHHRLFGPITKEEYFKLKE